MIICTDCIHQDVCGLEGSWDEALVSCTDKVEMPNKTGFWIKNADEGQNIDPPYICSECGNAEIRQKNYCSECGTMMQIKK